MPILTYQIHLEARANVVEVRYELFNDSEFAIYIFTPLTNYRGNDFVSVPERVYVTLDHDGLVRFAKQLWPVPPDVDVYMPEVPYLTLVKSGERFTETLYVPLPLVVSFPYDYEDPDSDAPRKRVITESREAAFRLGYVDDGAHLEMRPAGGNLYRIEYKAIAHQKLLTGERIALRVPVADRVRE